MKTRQQVLAIVTGRLCTVEVTIDDEGSFRTRDWGFGWCTDVNDEHASILYLKNGLFDAIAAHVAERANLSWMESWG